MHVVRCIQVVCTGTEDRILDCEFPQNFAIDRRPCDQYIYDDSYADDGVRVVTCRENDAAWMSVICRRFELSGMPLIPLHVYDLNISTFTCIPDTEKMYHLQNQIYTWP